MKKKPSPETEPEPPTDREEASAEMRRLITSIRESETQREPIIRELRPINEEILEKFSRRLEKAFESAAEAIDFASNQIVPVKIEGLDQLRTRRAELIEAHNQLQQAAALDAQKLAALVARHGSLRSAEITAALRALRENIRAAIRPFVADDKEAESLTQSVSSVHALNERTLGRWHRIADAGNPRETCLIADTLLRDFQTPLPA